jgi:O-antigen ligase
VATPGSDTSSLFKALLLPSAPMTLMLPLIFLSLGWFNADHFPPWVSWHSEIWTFAAVLWLSACLLFSKSWKSRFIVLPYTVWPILLLAIVLIAQTIDGDIQFVGDAWVLFFYLILCIFALAVGHKVGASLVLKAEKRVGAHSYIADFAILVVLAGLSSVAVAFVQALDVWEQVSFIHRMPMPRRPGANLGQTNQLATFVLFSLASLVYLFESQRVRVVTALPMAAILLFGLAITESRTGALSLLLMAVWWTTKRRSLDFVLSNWAVGLWLVFFACSFWFLPSWLSLVLNGGLDGSAVNQVNLSAGTRLLVWPQLWEAVLQRPWFGWGLGQVSVAHNAVLHTYAAGEPFTYAHNIVLDLALGLGLPLTLLFVVVTSIWLWRRIRDTKDLLSWYCLSFALPFGVHSMLEFPFAYAYLLVPVMLLVGVLEAHSASAHTLSVPWRTATAIWVLVGVCMAWSAVEYVAIEEDFHIARFEALNVGQTPGNHERPHIVLLTQLGALLEGTRLVATPNMPIQRIELARKVAMRFPTVPTQNRYALSLALNGDAEEAVRQLYVMRAMHGEQTYEDIRANWNSLAEQKYPQLGELKLP